MINRSTSPLLAITAKGMSSLFNGLKTKR